MSRVVDLLARATFRPRVALRHPLGGCLNPRPSAHVHAQRFRNGDGAVSVLMDLKQWDQDARTGNDRVVQCIGMVCATFRVLVPQVEAAALVVTQPACAVGLAVFTGW